MKLNFEYVDTMSKYRRTKIGAILLVSMFTLWLLSIAAIHISDYSADSLFYARKMPSYYWIGSLISVFILISIFSNSLHDVKIRKPLELAFIVLLILYLFGTPSFIYTNARLWDVHAFSLYVEEIINTNHISGDKLMYRGIFAGGTISFSILSIITDLKFILLAKYYTIYFFIIMSLSIYAFANKLLNDYCVFAPIALISSSWLSINHMTPQPYAYLLSTFLIPLLISILLNDTKHALSDRLLFLLFWFAIVIVHALTPILLIIPIVLILLLYNMEGFCNSRFISKSIYTIIAIFIVTYMSYIIFTSDFVMLKIIGTIHAIQDNLINGDMFVVTDRNIEESMSPSYSYKIGYWVRMLEIAFTVVLGLASTIFIYKNEFYNKKTSEILIALFLIYLLFSISFIGLGYNEYGYNRTYLFMLIPYSILVAWALDIKLTSSSSYLRLFRHLIVLFIMCSILLMPVARYASDPYGFIAESRLSSRAFISEHPELSNPFIFEMSDYNLFELKMQKGEAYLNQFNQSNFNSIYNAGQHKIYTYDDNNRFPSNVLQIKHKI